MPEVHTPLHRTAVRPGPWSFPACTRRWGLFSAWLCIMVVVETGITGMIKRHPTRALPCPLPGPVKGPGGRPWSRITLHLVVSRIRLPRLPRSLHPLHPLTYKWLVCNESQTMMPVGGGGAPPVPAAAAAPEHQLRAIATQVILSHNACPVCGFPLMWNLGNGQVDTPDRKWYYAQDALKNLPPLQIHRELAFGNRNRRNAEEFHMTDGYLTRDHAMSRIFYTPPIGLMGPESDFYQRRVLLRDAAQHQLFHFTRAQLRALFGNNLDNFRNSEFVERMSVLSRVLIVTCSPCNQNYIASAQLTSMFEAIYGGRVAGENPATENQFYTLLFDSLADPASFRVAGQTVHITVDAERQRYWQCEVWLVRSCLLFFAQQCNMLGGNKGLAANPEYRLRMGSSQMGVCDFLMTQILAPVFYEKYGISVHFVDLHRRFLMRLVIWAKENNAAPTNRRTVIQPPVAGAGGGVGPSTRLQVEDDSPLLLWRWVLGSRVVVPNGPPEARDEYNSPNRYWMDVPVLGLKTSADLIKDRVMDFVDDWGVRIGAARAAPGWRLIWPRTRVLG